MLTNPIDLKKFDLILLEKISFEVIIGILPKERVEKQKIILEIALGVDIKKSAKTKKIEDTLDYRFIKNLVEQLKQTKFELVESFIEFVADECLSQAGVKQVFLKLSKPQALGEYANVSLAIFREKN